MLRSKSLALIALFLLVGCSRAQKAPEPPQAADPLPVHPAEATSEAPVLIASAPHPQQAPTPPTAPAVPETNVTLHLLLPEGQAPAWLTETLQNATGAKFEIATYATDAELVNLLNDKSATYDLVGIDDRAAAELIPAHALRALTAEATAGLAPPSLDFLHHYFDPKNEFTWPYGWTLYAFAIAAPTDPKTPTPKLWRDLANASLSLPDDKPLRNALWALAEGKPPATADAPPEAWQKAAFDPKPTIDSATKVWIDTVAHLHPLLERTNEKWNVILPADGSLIVLYHWAIPANGAQGDLAIATFRALAAPTTAAKLDAESGLSVTQATAKADLPKGQQADPLLYPADRLMNQCRFIRGN